MSRAARHYFVYGNTAQGFVNKLSANLQGIEKLFIIKGRPGTGKACLMPSIAAECEKSGFAPEYLHCPSAPETYDGIIVPELNLAVIDGTDLHYAKPGGSVPGASIDRPAQYIDADAVVDGDKLLQSAGKIAELIDGIGICHENAFLSFASALRVHDEWEKIYIANMDFQKADLLASYTEELLLGGFRRSKAPVVKERFFGASTPNGAMHYIENLTDGVAKRYFLKGRPGTGKSTLLRKLAAASAGRGLNIEVYSCAFDSNSLDMLVWPELDRCIFDSTAPHLCKPSRPEDEMIDMYADCVRPGTDEKFAPELEDITRRYKEAVGEGTRHLAQAKGYLDELIGIYGEAANPDVISRLRDEFAGRL